MAKNGKSDVKLAETRERPDPIVGPGVTRIVDLREPFEGHWLEVETDLLSNENARALQALMQELVDQSDTEKFAEANALMAPMIKDSTLWPSEWDSLRGLNALPTTDWGVMFEAFFGLSV